MVRLEDAVIARYVHEGRHFEVLVDPYLAMDLKHGKDVNFNELLAADSIFKDAKKGDVQSPETLKSAFGTDDVRKVAHKIISEGDVQLTTEQRRQLLEKKRREIIQFISQNALNPQTNAPHPQARIEKAMEEAKIHVDPMRSVSEQMQDVLKELRKLLPISMDKMKVAVRISAQYAGKASAVVHKYDVKQEQWQADGSLIAMLEIPAGMKAGLFNELNSLTHGSVETKIIGRE